MVIAPASLRMAREYRLYNMQNSNHKIILHSHRSTPALYVHRSIVTERRGTDPDARWSGMRDVARCPLIAIDGGT